VLPSIFPSQGDKSFLLKYGEIVLLATRSFGRSDPLSSPPGKADRPSITVNRTAKSVGRSVPRMYVVMRI
jgi:hypothetical protein